MQGKSTFRYQQYSKKVFFAVTLLTIRQSPKRSRRVATGLNKTGEKNAVLLEAVVLRKKQFG